MDLELTQSEKEHVVGLLNCSAQQFREHANKKKNKKRRENYLAFAVKAEAIEIKLRSQWKIPLYSQQVAPE